MNVVGEGGEVTVVCGAKLRDWDERGCFDDAITHLVGSLDRGVDGIDDADEDGVVGLEELADDSLDTFLIWFAAHLEVETARLELKEIGPRRVIDVGAVCGVMVAAGAGVDPDALQVADG